MTQTEPVQRPMNALESNILGVRWDRVPTLVPGVVVAAGLVALSFPLSTAAGHLLAHLQGRPIPKTSPLSAITVGIVLGLLVANVVGVFAPLKAGLDFCTKKLLRLGIILVGLKLSLLEVAQLGTVGVPVVLAVVCLALVVTPWMARRIGVSDNLGLLTAASTAICGVTATLAVAPTIEAEENEVAYAVANVTLFGLFGMLVYPHLAHFMFGANSLAAGLFLGTAIHDTSQVMGAAMAYRDMFGDARVLQVATVTKLVRNVCLVGVVPLLAYQSARQKSGKAKQIRVGDLFPTFVLGFLGMAVVRTIGESGLRFAGGRALWCFDAATWKTLIHQGGEMIPSVCLGMAMASVGLSTRFAMLGSLGLRPLYAGASSALLVGTAAAVLAHLAALVTALGV